MASATGEGLPQGDLTTRMSLAVKRLLNFGGCSSHSKTLLTSMRNQLERALPHVVSDTHRLLDCSNCEGYMAHPVCLPCGHSLCKSCMERGGGVASCPRCMQSWPRAPPGGDGDRRPTVVLQHVLQKWFSRRLEACQHREEGNRFALEGDFPLAVHWYNKAVETGMCVCVCVCVCVARITLLMSV